MDAVAKGSRGAFDGAEADATTQLSAVFLEVFYITTLVHTRVD
jgi:hypothetical protein